MVRKLRAGIIGAGTVFAKLHYPAYRELADKIDIVAVCDQDQQRANYWARKLRLAPQKDYSDFRSMVVRDDVDIIDIMVPIELNYQITAEVAALVAGSRKWIVCEKPPAADREEAAAAAALAQTYRVPVIMLDSYGNNEETHIRSVLQILCAAGGEETIPAGREAGFIPAYELARRARADYEHHYY